MPEAGEDGAAFTLDSVPSVATDLGKFQSSIGLDLLDHAAQGIYMGGKGTRIVIALAGPGGQQGTFACAREPEHRKGIEGLLGQGDGRFCQPGGTGSVEQLGQKVEQELGVNFRQVGHAFLR